MKLSIITVVRNDVSGLQKTMVSILRHLKAFSEQQLEIELIIQDGLSTDGTFEVASSFRKEFEKFDHKFSIFSEKDKSLFHAMNIASSKIADDTLVAYINAGDTLYENLNVPLLCKELDEFWQSDAALFFGVSLNFYQNVSYQMPNSSVEKQEHFLKWIKTNTPVHQAVIFKTNKNIPLHYRMDWKIMSDAFLIYYIMKFNEFRFRPIILCEFELGGQSSDYSTFSWVSRQIFELIAISRIRNEPVTFAFFRINSLLVKYLLSKVLGQKKFLKLHLEILKRFK